MTDKLAARSLGKALKKHRENLGLSQGQLAKRAGVSRSGYIKTEHGLAWPGAATLSALAAALGVSVGEIMAGVRTPVRSTKPVDGVLLPPKKLNIKNLSAPDLLWIQYKLLNASVDIRSLVLGILLNDTSLLTDEVRRFLEKLDLSGFDKLAKAD